MNGVFCEDLTRALESDPNMPLSRGHRLGFSRRHRQVNWLFLSSGASS